MLASEIAQPGDVWLWECRTASEAGFPDWFADAITVNCQKWFCTGPLGLYLGSHRFAHAGIVIEWRGELCLLEWTPRGMIITPINERQKKDAGRIKGIPLNERYRPLFKANLVALWIGRHQDWHYRWGGLPFALVKRWGSRFARWLRHVFGTNNQGVFAFYCSEAVVSLLMSLGIWPKELAGVENREVIMKPMLADGYSPSELSEAPQFARNKMYAL